jgi:hypothetical protein
MTPDQQRLLAATYGLTWCIADILLDDAGIERARAAMQSGHVHGATGLYYATGARGIITYRLTGSGIDVRRVDEQVAVPWARVRAHRAALPAATLARLRDAVEAEREHRRAYPTPYPDLGVRRVGPSSDIHPDDRGLYRERMDTYQRDVVGPWRHRSVELLMALQDAVRACLPALDEPADLLDHLAAVEAAS